MSINPQPPNVLTSWKEIAAYLGKGVRTVQRWEQQLGLPIRRPGLARHVVIGVPSELDTWVSQLRISSPENCCDSRLELRQAQQVIAELREENARLRAMISDEVDVHFQPARAECVQINQRSLAHSDKRSVSHPKQRLSA